MQINVEAELQILEGYVFHFVHIWTFSIIKSLKTKEDLTCMFMSKGWLVGHGLTWEGQS